MVSASPPAVYVSRHPLVVDKMARLRDTGTDPAAFRTLVRDLELELGVTLMVVAVAPAFSYWMVGEVAGARREGPPSK